MKKISKEIESFHRLVGEQLTTQTNERHERIEVLYERLRQEMPKNTVEWRAVENLYKLLKN